MARLQRCEESLSTKEKARFALAWGSLPVACSTSLMNGAVPVLCSRRPKTSARWMS